MIHKEIQSIKDVVSKELLPFVRKPGRYIGGEVNQVVKDLSACDVRVALCFPDIYEIGMSYLGMEVLYSIVNRLERAAAERVFAPWFDAEQVMRDKGIPLFTMESHARVKDFDPVGFSLTNELCYTNLLNMLDLAGLEVHSENRTESDPIVIVGGQASNCAEPLSAFVDMFVLGEGEEAAVEIVELCRKMKIGDASKEIFLLECAKQFSFVYVPRFYETDDAGLLKAKIEGLRIEFENAVVKDFENAPIPEKPIVPFVQTVHERVSIEIMRGCPGRCRFCQASFCRRPVRVRSVERILEAAIKQYKATGFNTVSLLSLSTSDYPYLEELVEAMNAHFAPLHVGLSVPSLRVQKQLQLLPKMVTSVRKGGLTIAVEAASEHLRSVINKPITDEDLFAAVTAAFEAGFLRLKLYFMVGFPGETEDDILRIVDLSQKLSELRKEVDGKCADITAAISWLVPKAHTPFGWLGQKDRAYFENAKELILSRKRELNLRFVRFNFHACDRSILESAMGRGDRRLNDVVETAWRNGAKFDLWDEGFDLKRWQDAFTEAGLNLETEAQKSFTPDQQLPWSHLGGPDTAGLLKHYRQSMGIVEG